jgi:hypothetical protein
MFTHMSSCDSIAFICDCCHSCLPVASWNKTNSGLLTGLRQVLWELLAQNYSLVRNWWNQWCSSHGSLWMLFVMKKVMMVWHFVHDSHKVMTVLIVLQPCNFLLWRFLCILISCILSQWCPLWYLQQLDLVFPSSRNGCWSHDGAVISAVLGSIKGSSSCLLTQALLLPDVCSALCHVNLSLVACFLAVSILWVAVFF